MKAPRILEDLELRGELVRLRPPRVEEAQAVFDLIGNRREILDWIEWAGPTSVEDMREQARLWRTTSHDAANYRLAILLSGAGAPVAGAISLRFIDHPQRCDLGYWIGARYQGRGLASAAVGHCLWLAFEVLEADSASACVFVDNFSSRRVLEKHGFELRAPECGTSACDARPRWNFALAREAWKERGLIQRPIEFELSFGAARP